MCDLKSPNTVQIVFNPLREHEELEVKPATDTEYHLQLVHTILQFERDGSVADPYQVGAIELFSYSF